MDTQSKRDIFVKMNKAIVGCTKCRLCRNRKNAVPGEGNINADVMFLGESPGKQEDETGRPFIGRSGRMLNDLIRKLGLTRRDVWIGNIVKCMPPDNRDPMVDEVRACSPYLDRQIELIKPKVVVPLGRVAMEYFLPNKKISEVHGKPFRVKSFIVCPVYHPAAALRNRNIKRILDEDFSSVKDVLTGKNKDIPHAKKLSNEDVGQGSLF